MPAGGAHDTAPPSEDAADIRMPSTLYSLHDLTISLTCADQNVADALEATLEYKGATQHTQQPADAADMTLAFSVDDVLPQVPAAAVQVIESDDDIAVFRSNGCYYLRHPAAFIRIDPEEQCVEGRVGRSLAQAAPEQRLTLFYLSILSLVVLLQQRGLLVLHAAALARQQQGLLLIGHSGSGKSTTAFNLVRQGWGYLSDDTVLLQRREDRVRALSFRKNFCIAPEAATYFPELRNTSWPRSLSNAAKWSVDVEALYDAPALPQCEPRYMLFPSVEPDAPSRLEPLPDREAFMRLVYQTPIWITKGSPESALYMQVLQRLLSQTTSYRLFLSQDLLDAPEELGRLVSSLAAS